MRAFFAGRDFLEVATPLRVDAPATELHIEAEPSGPAWLRTSPELHMKRLVAAGFSRIWQLGPCFRQGERGRLHHPEFAMLEWYRSPGDYTDILADTRCLLDAVATAVHGEPTLRLGAREIRLDQPWERIAVRDAFIRAAGWDPVAAYDADRFDLDLVEKVEPSLPREVPVVLADYPAACAALARRKPGSENVAERWELYLDGIEIANAYSELTDAAEQRARFETCRRERASLGRADYPLDEPFLEAVAELPPCGGIALGFDRLVMLLANASGLDEVNAFMDGARGAHGCGSMLHNPNPDRNPNRLDQDQD